MSNHQEKKAFSARLTQALIQARHPLSPTHIANEFNLRYLGQAISIQSANNWILGKAIPNQDKLAVLSIWLNVSNQWLRFGDADPQSSLAIEANSEDIDFFLKYRSLTNLQKKLIHDLLQELR
ncbi:hypothetical protein EC844_102259 [Acinetobacter calcoaceticus]|uniref:Transcriptional regulator n=1 Tax=Acinetobacter calcoaceticus TaxID=471 RepID=A0A4R1Y9W7_ACICA|nr:hypothetical protein EC844_102259 [Acinetobacter calcoaceticus]